MLASLYDVYIALPLRLESWLESRRSGDEGGMRGALQGAKGAEKRVAGEGVA
jgi:hypothetical protein